MKVYLNFRLEDQMGIPCVCKAKYASKLIDGQVTNIAYFQLWWLERMFLRLSG